VLCSPISDGHLSICSGHDPGAFTKEFKPRTNRTSPGQYSACL